MNTLQKYILGAALILSVVAIIGVATKSGKISESQIDAIVERSGTQLGAIGTRFVNGLSTDSTSPSAGQVRTTSLTVTGASTLTGTTSPTQLKFPVGGSYTLSATGTVITLYTNTTGPKLCDSHSAFWLFQNNGSFAPSLIGSVGSSTSAIASTNIIASSTVATTSTTIIPADALASNWRLAQGDVITAIIGQQNDAASSTYLGRWSGEFGINCQELAI